MVEGNVMLRGLLVAIGNENAITIHKEVVDFFGGDYESAIMLEQLLYWTPRATIPGGWISKSDKEWRDEIYLSRHQIKRVRELFISYGFLETKVKRYNSVPTMHYRIVMAKLEHYWNRFAVAKVRFNENDRSEMTKTSERNDENVSSLTESTTENTSEKREDSDKHSNDKFKSFVMVLGEVTGQNLKIKSNWAILGKLARELIDAGYSSQNVRAIFGGGGTWYKLDFRGKKGEKPNVKAIREKIDELDPLKNPDKPQELSPMARREMEARKRLQKEEE